MDEKSLIIAEKPSVAADLVKALPGKFTKSKTHYESDQYVVSFAIGHLVSICYPEEIDPRFKSWTLANLPIIPESFPLKSIKTTSAQLNGLKKLIRRKDITEIINACDAGREGELIFKYILQFTRTKSVDRKTIRRLWLQSMTKESILHGFKNLRDDESMKSLEATAVCRSESDWLIGINASRALTAYNSRKGGFFKTPCGRVQTPTLSLIVKREKERMAFKPQTYYQLEANFSFCSEPGSSYAGSWIDPEFKKDEKKPHAKANRLWNQAKAEALVKKCHGQPATIEETSKSSTQRSPLLYDLTSLQREANSRFGFSARNTLNMAQALYEKHKILTYPRTDSRRLPEDYGDEVRKILKVHSQGSYAQFASTILEKNYVKPKDKRVFDNRKVSDHHAIIPTNVMPKTLSEPEAKIYRMVMERFLAVFYPAAEFLLTKRLSIVLGETFLTEGKILKKPGWKVITAGQSSGQGDKMLAPVPDDKKGLCEEIELKTEETKPPPRYTEATLLSAMEHSDKLIEDEELRDAMKERGLGTPATRAAIIEGLINEKYLSRELRDLAPTGKAFDLFNLISGMEIEELASPELTGEWEYKLKRILKGDLTAEDFMSEIKLLTEKIISRVKKFDKEDVGHEASFSPVQGQKIIEAPTSYTTEGGTITIRKVLGGRLMTEAEVIDLFEGKTIGPFDDFRSKKGKPFTATIHLKDNKVEFMFPEKVEDLDPEEVKKGRSLGLSPVDNTPVYQTPTAYISESSLDGNPKGLRISTTILSRKIEPEYIEQMLSVGKTELITGFISKKKRPFDAYLLLDKKGKISFEFPPRKPKKKAKAKES